MTGPLSTLAARVGRRGAALLTLALLDAIYCYGLLNAPRPLTPFYAWQTTLMPIYAWAIWWAVVGAICLVFAFCTWDTPAFIAAVALKVGWALVALLGWLDGAVDRGYISAGIFLVIAGGVFLVAGGIPPAPPRPLRRRLSWTP
jgi:hypothetical protein